MYIRLIQYTLVGLFVTVGMYLVLPSPKFSAPPPGSIQSLEPADTESKYRSAYFTNLTRQEIMDFFWYQFGGWGIRLNHPPEESQTLIRDQTRSSYLEEIVHPGRESLYVNGFVPSLPTEQINIGKIHYLNKVTVRYIPSHPISRLTVLLMTLGTVYLLVKEYALA